MRFVFILVALFVRFAAFAHAQRIHEEPEPDPGRPSPPQSPGENPNPQPPSVPGAPGVGKNPKPAPEDDKINFEDIAKALAELVKKIKKAVDDSHRISQTANATTTTQGPLPAGALPCDFALSAYNSCTTAYDGTFSAVTTTVQAGCLCNADKSFDFNHVMKECYGYAQSSTQLRSYASVIANGTAACQCRGCTPTTSPATTTSITTTTTSSSNTVSSATAASQVAPATPTSAAIRSWRAFLGIMAIAAVSGLMAVVY